MALETNVSIDTASLEVPASYVNRFHVLVSGPLVRIAFSEGVQGKDFHYRSAIIMTADDAKELTGLLSNLLTRPGSRDG
jgi:hypothetical protein